MVLNKNNLIDISICIPTRNRASLLSKCLEHLSTFTLINFEIIIGDNASTDDTERVAQAFSTEFPAFTYHCHTKDIGFSRNMDAILRMARGEYIYILSDDDLVFENALIEMKNILDTMPSAVAVSGKYLDTMKTKVELTRTYNRENVLTFNKGDFLSLAKNFLVCDGHPFMRTGDLFQRHCMYHDRSFCLTPLFFKLLSFGEISISFNSPCFPAFSECSTA